MSECNKYVVAAPDLEDSPCSSSHGELEELCGLGVARGALAGADDERSRLLAEMGRIERRLAGLGHPSSMSSDLQTVGSEVVSTNAKGGCHSGAVTQTTSGEVGSERAFSMSTTPAVQTQPLTGGLGFTPVSIHGEPAPMPRSRVESRFPSTSTMCDSESNDFPVRDSHSGPLGTVRIGMPSDAKRKFAGEYVTCRNSTRPLDEVEFLGLDPLVGPQISKGCGPPLENSDLCNGSPAKVQRVSSGVLETVTPQRQYVNLFQNPEYLGALGKQICRVGVSSLLAITDISDSRRSIALKLQAKMEDSLSRVRSLCGYFWDQGLSPEACYYPPIDKAWSTFYDAYSVLKTSFEPQINVNVVRAWYAGWCSEYESSHSVQWSHGDPPTPPEIMSACTDAYMAQKNMQRVPSPPTRDGSGDYVTPELRQRKVVSSSESESDCKSSTYRGRRGKSKRVAKVTVMSELPPSVGYVSPVSTSSAGGPKGSINMMHQRSDFRGSLQLPLFTGRGDFESWYDQFYKYRGVEQWDDDVALNKVLCSLRDEAHSVAMSLNETEIRSLKTVIKKLVDTFRREDFSAVALKDFTSLRLADCDGDYRLLASRLQELYRRANPQATEAQAEAQVKYQFFVQMPAYLQILYSWQSGLSVRELANKCEDCRRLTEGSGVDLVPQRPLQTPMASLPPPAYTTMPPMPTPRSMAPVFGTHPGGAPVQVIGGAGQASSPPFASNEVLGATSEPVSLKGPQSMQSAQVDCLWNQRVKPDMDYTYGDIKDAVVTQLTKLGVDSINARPAVINAINGFRDNQSREPDNIPSANGNRNKKRHCIYCDMDGHEERSCFRKICHSIYADCIKSLQSEINVLQQEQKTNDSLLLGLSRFMIEKHGFQPDPSAWAQKFPGEKSSLNR